jgi:hypothetical protein
VARWFKAGFVTGAVAAPLLVMLPVLLVTWSSTQLAQPITVVTNPFLEVETADGQRIAIDPRWLWPLLSLGGGLAMGFVGAAIGALLQAWKKRR